ncbi:MAG: ComEC/Rec2 family competence protein [Lachnospiraceae bacterium]|nr:ComEC/Rec2 family competence protein [Lachnospiraceae bacterium]
MRRPLCVYTALFLLCLVLFLPYVNPIPADHDRIPFIEERTHICVRGTITDLVKKEEKTVVELKDVVFEEPSAPSPAKGSVRADSTYGLKVYFPADQDLSRLKMSQVIRLNGIFHKYQRAENEGQFDTRAHYYFKGVDGYVTDPQVTGYSKSYSGFRQRLLMLRLETEETFKNFLSPEDAGILSALLTGDKALLGDEIRELYRNAGIAHVLSLSGLHVAIFGLGLLGIVKSVLRKLGAKTKLCSDLGCGGKITTAMAAIISGAILLSWCVFTGFAVSTIRAFIMFALGVVADLADRTYDLLSAAAFSSIIAACISPLYLYDAGFQLSFAAVLSIGIIQPALAGICGRYAKSKVLQALLLGISIQLGTLPIVAWHFCQVSLCGIFLNLLVVPLMTVVLVSGAALAGMGILLRMTACLFFEVMCRTCGYITSVILNIYDKCAIFGTLPRYSIWVIGRPKPWQILFYYAILIVFIIVTGCFTGKTGRKGNRKTGSVRVLCNDQFGRHKIGLQRFFMPFLHGACLLTLLIIAVVIIDTKPSNETLIRNLSVGQGDCSIIFSYTHVIIIDCGSSTENEPGKYRLLPCLKANGVGKVDTVFLSHFDTDHVNGVMELLSDAVYRNRIGRIVISKMAPLIDGETENYQRIKGIAEENGIPVYLMKAGDEIMIGDATFLCLSPEWDNSSGSVTGTGSAETGYNEGSGMGYPDTNEASLVLRMTDETHDFSALFTGDIGQETEERILKKWGSEALMADYLKVAHHGSKNSSAPAFLQAVFGSDRGMKQTESELNNRSYQQRFAVISVGKNNRYGHPNKETLNTLDSISAIQLYRTDRDGETILRIGRREDIPVMETFLYEQ